MEGESMSKKKSKKKENNGISSMTSPSQAGKTKYQLTRTELMELIILFGLLIKGRIGYLRNKQTK